MIKNFRHKSGIRDRILIRVFPIRSDQWIGHVRQRKPHFSRKTTYRSETSFATPLGNARQTSLAHTYSAFPQLMPSQSC